MVEGDPDGSFTIGFPYVPSDQLEGVGGEGTRRRVLRLLGPLVKSNQHSPRADGRCVRRTLAARAGS